MQQGKLCSMLAAAGLLAHAGPANAIKYGDLDGDGHPHVGILVFDDEAGPAWRCSGTLIAPAVVLTAGHCTFGAVAGRAWFASTEAEIRGQGYPFGGSGAIEAASIHTSPNYNDAAFFLNDVGVVILSTPVSTDTYGVLPSAGQLNSLQTRRGLKNQTFTAVGYGLQYILSNNPVNNKQQRSLDRMYSTPQLLQINTPGFTGDFSILLSNNHATGGTCFGDSGGPNFLGDSNVVGGVTSFGINGNCAGTGGVYRMDRAHDIEWVSQFLD